MRIWHQNLFEIEFNSVVTNVNMIQYEQKLKFSLNL